MVNDDGYHIWLMIVNNITAWWLLLTPLKNDGVSSSVGMMTFPTEWKKHVPNHQLDYNRKYLTSQSPVKSKITIQYEHYEHIQYYNSILQLYTNGITNTRYYNYSIYQWYQMIYTNDIPITMISQVNPQFANVNWKTRSDEVRASARLNEKPKAFLQRCIGA